MCISSNSSESSGRLNTSLCSSRMESDVAGPGESLHVPAASVTAEFFETLGVLAALGKTFLGQNGVDGVVVGDALWRKQFGADASIIGRRVIYRRC